MRRLALALAIALAAGGCNAILGLDPTHRGPEDAAPVDGPPGAEDAADAAPDASPCMAIAVAQLVADGIFIEGDAQNHATLGVINISANLNSTGIMRFAMPALPPGITIAYLTLTLPFAAEAADCGSTSCGSCASLDRAGSVNVAYLRSDWDEATVSYTQRADGKEWGLPGAKALTVDRSPQLGSARPHAADATTVIVLSGTDLDNLDKWSSSGELSFAVTPTLGTALLVGTREHDVLNATCAPVSGPTLTITYCQ
ncbi:MAG: hypothetical protein K8W52_40710 [Deltaproteobacteria bacterium]|nr:hypothetical protein [Deltaproteobacteria bacterium]